MEKREALQKQVSELKRLFKKAEESVIEIGDPADQEQYDAKLKHQEKYIADLQSRLNKAKLEYKYNLAFGGFRKRSESKKETDNARSNHNNTTIPFLDLEQLLNPILEKNGFAPFLKDAILTCRKIINIASIKVGKEIRKVYNV